MMTLEIEQQTELLKLIQRGEEIVLLQHNKQIPDSLLAYFAGMDEYRYELFTDLKKMKKPEKFIRKPGIHEIFWSRTFLPSWFLGFLIENLYS